MASMGERRRRRQAMNQAARAAQQGAAAPVMGSLITWLDREIQAGRIGTRPHHKPVRCVAHPLEALVDGGRITRPQFRAGCAIRADWLRATGAPPSLVVNYSGAGGGGSGEHEPLDAIEAHARLRWLIHPERMCPVHWRVLHDVCHLGQAPSAWASACGLRRASGLDLLRAALDHLADLLDRYPAEGLGLRQTA